MLVERMPAIIEDRVEPSEILRVWTKPSVDVHGLDVDDGAVVTGCGHLRLRLVCDGGEQQPLTSDH